MSDYEDKLKEVEGKCQPIMMKFYQGGEGGGGEGASEQGAPSASGSASGPTVEEVD